LNNSASATLEGTRFSRQGANYRLTWLTVDSYSAGQEILCIMEPEDSYTCS
jgi:hypothetical protein